MFITERRAHPYGLILIIIPHNRTALGASQKNPQGAAGSLQEALAGAGSGDAPQTTGIAPTPSPKSPLLPLLPPELIPHRVFGGRNKSWDFCDKGQR